MGIKDLSKVIGDHAAEAVSEKEMKTYFGRVVAIDASMSLYQFLIAIRTEGDTLTNADGEATSHLSGFFYRTIRMVSHGIKPLYVFDGKPPTMKNGELAKRTERRKEAQEKLEQATETGNEEDIERFSRRLVKATREHSKQAQELLTFMGIPFVVAPCEAEAQCAELVKGGVAYATATEDMDALTFGSPILLRHMTFSEARKMPIKEIRLQKVLEGLDLTMEQFTDLCILLGCDYVDKIHGIGRKTAMDLIRDHKSIESILTTITKGKTKYQVPTDWKFAEARELFKKPEVTPAAEFKDLKWTKPNVEGLIEFMCEKNGFDEGRIRGGAEKLEKARGKSTQVRLDSFFKAIPSGSKNSAKAKRKSQPLLKKGKSNSKKTAKRK